MADFTIQIDALIKSFAGSSEAARLASLDIIKALQSSPALVGRMQSAITNYGLKQILFLPSELVGTKGGDFLNGVLRISPTYFGSGGSESDKLDGLVTVMAHEISHAAFEKLQDAVREKFLADVGSMYNIENRSNRDYTEFLRDFVRANLLNEANAAMVEWNILRDRLEAESPLPIDKNELLMRAQGLIPGCVVEVDGVLGIAPGISLNDDLSVTSNIINREGFYQCYANVPYYRNFYGSWGVGVILEYESSWGFVDATGIGNVDPNFFVNFDEAGLVFDELTGIKYSGKHGMLTVTDTTGGGFGMPRNIFRIPGKREDTPHADEYLAIVKMVQTDEDYIRAVSKAGSLGGAFGSAIASVLPIDNALLKVVASATLRTIGQNLAEAIKNGGISSPVPSGTAMLSVLDDLPEEFKANLQGAFVGAISSYLTAELFTALGIEGTLGEIAQTAAGSVLTQVVSKIAAGASSSELFTGLDKAAIFNAIGSYIGVRLASELVEFDTIGGQIGAQIGASVGAYVGATYLAGVFSNLGWAAGPVGALVGAFVGYILGGIIGSFFSSTPESSASLVWKQETGKFAITNVRSRHGGSKEAARAIAGMVANSLETILSATGSKLVDGRGVDGGVYGMRGKKYTYRSSSGGSLSSNKIEEVTEYGTYVSLTGMLGQMIGGDVYMKRALKANLQNSTPYSFDPTALTGDFVLAADYSRYMANPALINMLIEAAPESVIAAQWAITFMRARELGLDKRAHTDWIGGFGAFLDQSHDGALDGNAWSAANLQLRLDEQNNRNFDLVDNNGLRIDSTGDTISYKDRIAGSVGNDTIVVSTDTIADASGLTINGQAATGVYRIQTAAVIDGGDGNDTILGGDLGNDLLGGAGNDTLVGGKLDDWLFGGNGDDVLFAGRAANTNFAIADKAAEDAAVATDGGNGNYLVGGDGSDRLYGGSGSDWLNGSAGSDRLVGGSGGDILQGGAGDDRGANGEAAILGGAGSDQYLFGFGDGKDAIFDESDPAGVAGVSRDSLAWRIQQLENGALQRDWAGNGDYQVDGSVKGGEDAIAFGAGITMANILMRRSGNDLVIGLMAPNASGFGVPTGDELTVRDWFESTRRVEWLRFSDGEEIRLGDLTSFVIGTGESDVILGSYGADFLYGGGGDDVIRGLAGNDFGNGGSGNDFVAGDGDNDWVLGGSGDDQVIGGAGHDTAFGDDGDDRVYGGIGADLVVGGRGNDEVVGGAGDDVFRYSRGDGQDVVMDDYVNNWDLVWQNGVYANGYVLQSNGTVTKNGIVYFDGSKWLGQYDWDDEHQTLKRHAGAVGGVIASDSGTDTLEFGVGIDIQDLMLQKSGNDLLIGVSDVDGMAGIGEATDRITIKDWYSLGAPIENFVFTATGRHAVSGMNIGGGTDDDDTLAGTTGQDWLTGNGGDDVLDGGAGADILVGNAGSDTLKGGADADVLYGGAGDDVLEGGLGADVLFGGDGVDVVSYANAEGIFQAYLDSAFSFANIGEAKGDSYSDVEGFEGRRSYSQIFGGDSGDNVFYLAAYNKAYGGAGDDDYVIKDGDTNVSINEGVYGVGEVMNVSGNLNTAQYTANWEYLGYGATGQGDRHKYRLTVTHNLTGTVVYQSTDGADYIYTTQQATMPASSTWLPRWKAGFVQNTWNGKQVLHQFVTGGGDGADTISLQARLSLNDIFLQKSGNDLTLYNATTSQLLATIAGHYLAGREVEALQLADGLSVDLRTLLLAPNGGLASDLIFTTTTANGQGGNDVLAGYGSGNQTLVGGDGDDILEGGAGSDTLDGGTDSITASLEPQPGIEYGDTIRYVSSSAAVAIDLAASTAAGGHAAGDVLVKDGAGVSTIENVTGSEGFGDTLNGDARHNRLAGLGGDDVIDGRAGDDMLSGGTGADTLYGGEGVDALAGDVGNDRLEGGAGKDLLSGGEGDDQLYGDGDDDQLGGDAGNDTLYGGAGSDSLGGWQGDDTLYGEAGNDKLAGGDGNDTLYGGDGVDQLAGEGGNDQLHGGTGSDSYLFDANSGIDTIVDAGNASDKNKIFVNGVSQDRIWLSRAGDDLRISVIDGNTFIVVSGFFKVDQTGSRVYEVVSSGGSLFLDAAGPLLQAMGLASATLPPVMPQAILDMLEDYWHPTGKASPQVLNQAFTTDEDVAISGQVGAVDQDSNITGYSLSTAAKFGSVALNAATGVWTYTPNANWHGDDRFVVTVTDADGNNVSQTVAVKVVSVNDAPSDIFSPGSLQVDEGAGAGLSLGTFTREDVDGASDTPTFQLLDDAGGRFAMSAEGKLTVLNGSALDYEAQTSHTITVRVTDQAGAYFDKQFTVTVRNVNEVPYIVTPPATTVPTVVSEMATGGGGTVASFVIGDPDNTVPTLELTTNPYGWLETVGNTVRIKQTATIDFEALAAAGATLEDTDGDGLKEIRLTGAVRATDGTLSSATPTSFVFLIEDANDAPTSIAFDPVLSAILERDLPEEDAELLAVLLGTLSATDPDIYGSADFANIAFSVEDSRFEIVNGNQLRLKAGAALDFEAGATVTLAITATDRGGTGLSLTRNLVFAVADADDYLYGTAGADTLSGQANRDVIYGYGNSDTIAGGEGNDDLYGGDGADVLMGDGGNDRLWGELGDDQIQGGIGADELHGGDGADALLGMNGNDSLFGDAGNDRLDGGQDNDTLDGGVGNDELYGSDGDDFLIGGDGDDLIEGGADADRMRGGDGSDTLSYASSASGVVLNLATGANGGGAAGDVIEDFFERVIGSAAGDTITGTFGNDVIDGGFGSDTIYGGAGDDLLIGGAGNDYIDAQSGNDTLIGGAGNDILVGGDDSDVYLIDANSGADEIRNYDPSGGDLDAIGYQDIDRSRLWFSRSGDDLVISVIGTSVQTTIKSWYAVADGSDRANYKIDFIIAGQHYSDTIDAEGLVALMASYIKPATQAAYDVLHQDLAFENRWKNYWDANGAPAISVITDQTIAEDGTITVQFRVDDDITPYQGVAVQATAGGVVLNAPTLGAPDANGVRTLTLHGAPNRSGQVVVTLTATDPGGFVSQRTFMVNVTPQADAPLITRALAMGSGFSSGSIALDVQAALVDQDGSETLEIRISNVPTGLSLNQGTDLGGGMWSLTPAQLAGLTLLGPASWDQDLTGAAALTITAISREIATGQTAQTTLSLAVLMNVAPSDIAADRALSVDELTAAGTVPAGTLLANFSGTDVDGDALTFSLVNNAEGRFTISTGGVLTVANGALLDHEAAASHVVRVKITDPSGLSYEEDFTITINNVNEAPTTPTATVLIPVGAENSALAGQVVANLAATDPDGTTPSYVISSDPRSWFTIVGNQLKFRTGLTFDFETLKAAGMTVSDIDGDGRQEVVYTAEVKATDGSLQSSGTRSVTVRIEDVNDAPTNINADRTLTVVENVANGTLVGNFTGVDQDAGDGLTFTLVNNAGGRFGLTAAGQLTVANGGLLNYEADTSHSIVIRVSDGTATYDETFNVAVINVNEAPTTPTVATQPITTVVEGTALSGVVAATLSATDPDGTAPSYAIASDPGAWFTISGNQLKFKSGFNSDFESLASASGVTLTDADGDGQKEATYSVGVRATDGSLNSGVRTVTVRIEDTNEAPVISTSSFAVSESAPGAGQTLIGTVAVVDPDTQANNRDFRYSLTGGDTSRFSINQTTGQLYLQGSLNYEAATIHQVQVTVKDQGGSGLTVNKTITVNVSNVNEAPVLPDQSYARVANQQGVAAGTVVGNFSVSDPENQALSLQIMSVTRTGNSMPVTTMPVDTFRIQGNTLVVNKTLSLNMDPLRNWVASANYQVVVQATDSGGLSTIANFVLAVEGRWGTLPPVVLDLDGDGLEFVGAGGSSVYFDMNDDGARDRTGWVGADDGLLVLDRNGDGVIGSGAEISFVGDMQGAYSDLEGLKAFDSSGNGKLDAGDRRFAEFKVWRDANGDGVSVAEELWALADLGIVSIDLTGERTGANPSGASDNVIYATSVFTRGDGSHGQVGDVFLAYDGSPNAHIHMPDETGTQEIVGSRTWGRGRRLGLIDDRDGVADAAEQPGDRGSGDAAPGRVDRRADRDLTPAQRMAAAMQDDEWSPPERRTDKDRAISEESYGPTESTETQDPAAKSRSERRGARGPNGQRGSDYTYEPDTALARSALHDQLALSEKKRFQMVEAMASFSAQPYAQFGMGTGKDPKAVELLTSLPDLRMGA